MTSDLKLIGDAIMNPEQLMLEAQKKTKTEEERKRDKRKRQRERREAKNPSRSTRWTKACRDAINALEILIELQGEYESWRDNLPENLQGSALGEKLDGVVDLDLNSAKDTLDEAEGLDLPQGFGRD